MSSIRFDFFFLFVSTAFPSKSYSPDGKRRLIENSENNAVPYLYRKENFDLSISYVLLSAAEIDFSLTLAAYVLKTITIDSGLIM
jgi:hypothetical protein